MTERAPLRLVTHSYVSIHNDEPRTSEDVPDTNRDKHD